MWSPLPNKLSKVHCWRFVSKGTIEDGTVDKSLTNLHRVCPRDSGTVKSLHDAGVSACRRPSRQRIKGICGRIMCVKIRNGRERPLRQVVDDWPELTGSANVGRLGLKLKLIIDDHCVCEAYQEQGERRIKQIKLRNSFMVVAIYVNR